MEIISRIRSILASIDGVQSVIYDSYPSTNLRLDVPKLPAAVLYLVQGYDLDVSNGLRRETADLQVFFCKKTTLDAKGEDKDAIIESIEPMANDFIAAIMDDANINVEGDSVRIEMAYGNYDVFVCGLVVRIKVGLRQGVCIGAGVEPRELVFNESNPIPLGAHVDVRRYDSIYFDYLPVPPVIPK